MCLPDRVAGGLRLLFVGINPGLRSAEAGHHFAGRSNRFWRLLNESGLTREPIGYERDHLLPRWGYGLTNLVSRPTAGAGDLRAIDFSRGRVALIKKIHRYRPGVIALVGVTVYRRLVVDFLTSGGHRRGGRAEGARTRPVVKLGLQRERMEGADLFVLPNPSGRNTGVSYGRMLSAFRALKDHLDAGGR